MKIDWRRRVQRQINVREGLVVLWRDAAGGREALVMQIRACPNPSCDCEDVDLDGVLITRPFVSVSPDDKGLRFETLTPKGAVEEAREAEEPDQPAVHFKLDVCDGTLSAKPEEGGLSEEEIRAWLVPHLDDQLLDDLHHMRITQKGWDLLQSTQDEPPWEDWDPTVFVCHYLAFPASRMDAYRLDGRRYLAFFNACANPACDCQEAVFEFHDEGVRTGDPFVGAIRIELDQPRLPVTPFIEGTKPGCEELLQRIWQAFVLRHQDIRSLRAKWERIRRFGRKHLMPAYRDRQREQERPVARPEKVGRNAPCPCGSGRKYKRCCGR
jgi:hypothetical protein